MALFTYNPTSNVSPDPGQGGLAVVGNINTGHGSTTSSVSGLGTQDRTCKWTAIPAGPGGLITSITLKADWTQNGSLGGISPANLFQIQYSLNGGSSWNTLKSALNITSSSSGTSTQSLSITQSLAQVQVRDLLEAVGNDAGDTAAVTASVSNIRVEVVTVDTTVLGMM